VHRGGVDTTRIRGKLHPSSSVRPLTALPYFFTNTSEQKKNLSLYTSLEITVETASALNRCGHHLHFAIDTCCATVSLQLSGPDSLQGSKRVTYCGGWYSVPRKFGIWGYSRDLLFDYPLERRQTDL